MANMCIEKTKMQEQPAKERAKNFKEVSFGYTNEEAKEEAERCLHCKNAPCMQGCPVNVKIPEFIQKIKENNISEAYKIIKGTNSLPAVCGRVCPQENQCEKYCVRAIKGEAVGIGRLERFVADNAVKDNSLNKDNIKKNGVKIAVVGSGPSGLTCAGELAKNGFDVTIFEALHTPGGVLMYGIPEFRLPKDIVQKEISTLKEMGVKIETDAVIGKAENIQDLFDEGFKSVFVGTGAGLPKFMGIGGEMLNGVYSANELLTRINLMKGYKFPEYDTPVFIGKKAAVIGGGNVAMDAARCLLRMHAEEVYIVYRRSENELPARKEEIEHAKDEGVNFSLLTNPVEIIDNGEGWVSGMKCIKMELGEPDAGGRRRPVPIENSEFIMDVDMVVMAIGQSPNPLIKSTTENLETTSWGGIVINEETGETSIENVFAGGDAVTGAATVILAMGAGKKAAETIIKRYNK